MGLAPHEGDPGHPSPLAELEEGETMITSEYHIVQMPEDLELENGVAYHLRCEVDLEAHIIRIGVLDDGPMSITITGVTPFMGHLKHQGCCDDSNES